MTTKNAVKKPWFIYILRCKNGQFYTGISLNVQKRIEQHQRQGNQCAKYLRGKAPLTLVFQQLVGSKSAALKLEKNIKNLSRVQKTEIIRAGSFNFIQ